MIMNERTIKYARVVMISLFTNVPTKSVKVEAV